MRGGSRQFLSADAVRQHQYRWGLWALPCSAHAGDKLIEGYLEPTVAVVETRQRDLELQAAFHHATAWPTGDESKRSGFAYI